MTNKKTLKIQHDGQITVSHFSPLALGDTPICKVVAQALGMSETDYKQIPAKVTMTIEFKNSEPIAYWEDED